MKIIIALAALVATCVAIDQEHMTSFLYTNEKGETWVEDLTIKPNRTASPRDVTIYFYSSSAPNNPYLFRVDDVSAVANSPFSASKQSVFVIHGWQNSYSSDMCQSVKTALLYAYDLNVFVVDWSPISRGEYAIAHAAVGPIGQYVGGFINLLASTYGLSYDDVRLVGHSLGAHVAGNAGAAIGSAAATIVGLDPAGPLFSQGNTRNRLDASDARYVEAIHCNAGLLGVNFALGHSDFWPNGGQWQAGCNSDVTGACSHGRSYMYYAESVYSSSFVATQCSDYASYTAGSCSGNAVSSMGMYSVDYSASGSYYLTTNAASPFARG